MLIELNTLNFHLTKMKPRSDPGLFYFFEHFIYFILPHEHIIGYIHK